ncbi:MAG TPA: hypothetical protein DCM08_13785 [Microscillaceae bacterium]|nr:hypothetical protein [Microscillaceae bacterium]
MVLRGKLVDAHTRCSHYHSPLDIIAIKFKCCGVYYPCYQCHEEEAGHPAEVWPADAFDTPAILCGNCYQEISIQAYFDAQACCPHCQAQFNPRCSLHYHLYFEVNQPENFSQNKPDTASGL